MTARYARGVLAVTGLWAVSYLHGQTTPLQIVADSLPTASVGTAYLQQLNTTGGPCTGAGTATSSLDSGALPPGISVTSPVSTEKKWFVQGTPSTAGTFQFTVHVRWSHQAISPFDSSSCVDEAAKALTLTVQTSNGNPGPITPPGTPSPLTVDRSQITTTYHTGHFPPAADTVQVTGGSAVSFTVQSVTDSGGAWLSVTPDRGVTPATLSISYSISGLQPGTYTGRVILNAGSPITISVTLVVVMDSNIALQISPSALSFSMTAGGPDPVTQSFAVSVPGDTVIFQASVSAPPNGKWLTVSPTGAATPGRITASVISKDLSPGVYSGIITLSVPGASNSSRTVPVTFTIQAPVQRPAITANGVVDAAGGSNAIATGTWVSIFGTALASGTRSWLAPDFINGVLPTSLDGVSVTINGKPAPVAFISQTQINVLAPDDIATGLVPVQVKNSLGTSDSVLVLKQTAAPAFFQFSGTAYVAGTHANGSYLAAPGVPGTPAKPGETIVLYGTGFGATQPAISATAQVPAALPLARPEDLRIRIGGIEAAIAFAGLISPGVYQFNVVVPQSDSGDKTVVAELRGLLSRPSLLLTVQN